MLGLSQPLQNEVTAALRLAGREDLATRLKKALRPKETLTSREAAELLGVSSPNTVKNWIEGGYFPGAFKTAGGHWRFKREEVMAVRDRMGSLRARNRRGDVSLPDEGDVAEPPLL